MKIRAINYSLFFFLIVLSFSSCKFRKIEKSQDWRVKYEAALQYYEEQDYYRSSILFESILPIVRGLPEGEKVQFYLAYCQYHEGLYILASHQFKTFYESYGRSTYVQEAQYMYAYSLYADSPESNLDQKSSMEALAAMQNFLNKYPNSSYSEQTRNIIDEIQKKLEVKGYDNAFQYYKLKRYKAALVAFDNFSDEYPDSDLNENASYYKIMAQYDLAEQSIISVQLERYNEVKSLYESFIDRYPSSKFLSNAEKVYTDSLKKINELTGNKL
ncbi:MAG: outer membrane protein assembly factor BamD [Cyclobacteriaceae bacterium]|nr:outer membrane protein assembly factor BamD [Cyclobacteriaceae bacterium]